LTVQVPKGVVKLPLILNEKSSGVTLLDSTANVESEIVRFQVPKKVGIAVREGDRFAIYLRTSVPGDITAGTLRLYVMDANKATRFKVLEGPLKAFMSGSSAGAFNVDDRTKQFYMPAGYSRETDEWLIITFEGADVADDAQTKLLLEGVQFLQL